MKKKPRIVKVTDQHGNPFDPKKDQAFANKVGALMKTVETGQKYIVKPDGKTIQ
ncbi:hypothetical protein MO973_19700 [Paenibacillus sp. TRM 82003]|nr:hypothetical protein [Paenibacillus sp. TRM 82003]